MIQLTLTLGEWRREEGGGRRCNLENGSGQGENGEVSERR